MKNVSDISNYNIVGTLSNNEKTQVWIASKKSDPDSENLFIINKINNAKGNIALFKEFFSYYSAKHGTSDICNFFASENSFYIVFKYSKGECLSDRFEEGKLTDNIDKRFEILYSILLKLDSISDMPLSAFIQTISPENICTDIDDKIKITYNFDGILDCTSPSSNMIYKNISIILELMFSQELKNKYNNQLPIIIEKCQNNLYTSIPQLIVDLKKIEQTCADGNAMNYAKDFCNKNKTKIKSYSVIAGAVAAAAFIVYMGYTLFFASNSKISSALETITVGNITYITKRDADPNINNSIQVDTPIPEDAIIDLSVPSNSEIVFTDYIVQYGDTLESICKSNYSSLSFVSSITSFNEIHSDAQLVAGLVIKLPDETAVKTLHGI